MISVSIKKGCVFLNKRISKIRKDANMTQDAFAEKLGLTKNFISLIETGKREPSDRTIKDICREFNINYKWLTEGVEPMHEELDVPSMARIDAIMAGEDSFAKNLFREFAKLDENEWKVLEKIINNLATKKGD